MIRTHATQSRSSIMVLVATWLVSAAATVAQPVLFARCDLNGDGVVDAADLDMFETCASGSAVPRDGSLPCSLADADQDVDVDLTDFAAFQRCASEGLDADPDCAGMVSRFDFDGDGHINTADEAWMSQCMGGPGLPRDETRNCILADADGDGDADQADYGAFQACYSGLLPADPLCPGMLAPAGLTASATGREGMDITIQLKGRDPYRPNEVLPVAISSLPTAGSLLQANGSPITSVPEPVLDANGFVKFRPSPGGLGTAYATFGYTVHSPYSGLDSAPKMVSVNVTPNHSPSVTMDSPVGYEDTPFVVTLGGSDPDLPDDALTFIIWIPPTRGAHFYQLSAAGQPRLDLPPIGAEEVVTNPEGKVWFVPPLDFYSRPSFPSVAFRYGAVDSAGAMSAPLDVSLAILPIDDPPVASAMTYTATGYSPIAVVFLNGIQDIDTPSVWACMTQLPVHGTLYETRDGDLLSDPLTSVPFCTLNRTFYYARPDVHAFDCGPDDDPASFPRDDTFVFHANDGNSDSDSVTDTIRFNYIGAPARFTGPTFLTVAEDGQVEFQPTGTDPDGDSVFFNVKAPLPQRGTLYYYEPDAFLYLPVVPDMLLPFNSSIIYYPLPGANTSDGVPDIIHIQPLQDSEGNRIPRNCDYQIQASITPLNDPPVIHPPSGMGLPLVQDGDPVVAYPGVISLLSISDDARPADLLSVTLRGEGVHADHVVLRSTLGLLNVVQVSPLEVHFDGTLSSINTALANGIEWWPKPEEPGAHPHALVVQVNDQGHDGAENPPVPLTAVLSIPINIDFESGLPLHP